MLSQLDSDIMTTLKDMEKSQKELKHELMKICWYMRGGLSYSEASALSPTEREIIAQLVKDNMETTKKQVNLSSRSLYNTLMAINKSNNYYLYV